MRLSICLLRRNYFPNGHIYRGKDRLVKTVTPLHLARLKHAYEIEEQNMLLLRHPFLTTAESRGHSSALNKSEIRMDKFRNLKAFKKQSVLMEDVLNHLNVTRNWD